jgi:predicted amidohydrolase
MRTFAIAGLQLQAQRGDNTELIRAEVLNAKRAYAWIDMFVFGELGLFGLDTAHAQTLPGPAENMLCELARTAGVWLVPGSLFERSGDKIFNTCPVINPDGEVVLRYRKMYPFLPYEKGVQGGKQCGVFEVPGIGKFGVSICYDMWFPEALRQMVWMGAEVILHPSATNTIDRGAEVAIAQASAATQQCYFFDINLAGVSAGRSGVYGPGGEVIHQASVGREVILVEIDLDHVTDVRERGWHGLGQVLKSYRDAGIKYPVYEQGLQESPAFRNLGPMHFRGPRNPAASPARKAGISSK